MDVQGNAKQVEGNEIQIVIPKLLMFFSHSCCMNILTVSLYSLGNVLFGKRESRIFLVSHRAHSQVEPIRPPNN
jgi:hypothetical protein